VDFALDNVINAISLGALYALFSLGVALIFGIMRLINFAHGEFIMVGGYVLVLLSGRPLLLVCIVCITTVVVFALATERLAFRPLRGAAAETLLIGSFAISYLLQSLATLILGANSRSTLVSPFFVEYWSAGPLSVAKLTIVTISVTGLLLVVLTAFLNKTTLGLEMRATAEDFEMARVLGVRANRVVATAFAISGILAGVASILLVAQTGTATPTMGTPAVLVAFIATVIGGLGSLWGAAFGGFALGAVSVALQGYLPFNVRNFRDAFLFAAVIALLVLRPEGFTRRPLADRYV
jgi:branched-chain amino acid transport system permease protein